MKLRGKWRTITSPPPQFRMNLLFAYGFAMTTLATQAYMQHAWLVFGADEIVAILCFARGLWLAVGLVQERRESKRIAREIDQGLNDLLHGRLEHNPHEYISNVHPVEMCEGEPCTMHNRTDHHMRSFPQHWRRDRRIMERICSHGVGHPDPDEWAIRAGRDTGEHGCDGCCFRKKYRVKEESER